MVCVNLKRIYTERRNWTELNWHGCFWRTGGQTVTNYSKHRLMALVVYVTMLMYASTNGQWARLACLLVSLSEIKPRQFSSVTSVWTRLYRVSACTTVAQRFCNSCTTVVRVGTFLFVHLYTCFCRRSAFYVQRLCKLCVLSSKIEAYAYMCKSLRTFLRTNIEGTYRPMLGLPFVTGRRETEYEYQVRSCCRGRCCFYCKYSPANAAV